MSKKRRHPLVVRREVPQPNGTALVEIDLNLRGAPAPTREYFADVVLVDQIDGTVRMIFAQRAVGVDRFRSLLVLVLTEKDAARFLRSCTSNDFFGRIQRYLASAGGQSARLQTAFLEEPASSVTLFANLIHATYREAEAAMDFYRIPPFGLDDAINDRNIDSVIEPVVRITLLTGLMGAILDRLASFVLPEVRPDDQLVR